MGIFRRRCRTNTMPGYWVWPLAMWKGRSPAVAEPFGAARPGPGGIRHRGVDLMYARLPADTFPIGSPNGTHGFIMPNNLAALAAADGAVWSALPTPFGYTVVIDHAPLPYLTFYAHLEKLLVDPALRGDVKQRVRAGQAIGIIGHDLLDPSRRKHLHFELWDGDPANAIDPATVMPQWDVEPDPRERNASLVYRHLAATGEPFPPWLRELRGKSGAYVIREVDADGDSEIAYVGASVGRLHDTVLRHFQAWRRWWSGAAHAFDRDRCEVGVRITRPDLLDGETLRLVQRLQPRLYQLAPVRPTSKEFA